MTKLVNADTGEILLGNLHIADTFWKRFKGLQFQRPLPASSGMLLSPCASLHTCFMRFPIDVIQLNEANVVIGTRRDIVPWRAIICDRGTKRVIEVKPAQLDIAIGTRLEWRD